MSRNDRRRAVRPGRCCRASAPGRRAGASRRGRCCRAGEPAVGVDGDLRPVRSLEPQVPWPSLRGGSAASPLCPCSTPRPGALPRPRPPGGGPAPPHRRSGRRAGGTPPSGSPPAPARPAGRRPAAGPGGPPRPRGRAGRPGRPRPSGPLGGVVQRHRQAWRCRPSAIFPANGARRRARRRGRKKDRARRGKGGGVDAAHLAALGQRRRQVSRRLAPAGGRETHREVARRVGAPAQHISDRRRPLFTQEETAQRRGQTAGLTGYVVGAAHEQVRARSGCLWPAPPPGALPGVREGVSRRHRSLPRKYRPRTGRPGRRARRCRHRRRPQLARRRRCSCALPPTTGHPSRERRRSTRRGHR